MPAMYYRQITGEAEGFRVRPFTCMHHPLRLSHYDRGTPVFTHIRQGRDERVSAFPMRTNRIRREVDAAFSGLHCSK